MLAKITNSSRADQGVYTAEDGLQFVPAGKTRELTIADSYVERAQSLKFLAIEPVGADTAGDDGLQSKTILQLKAIAADEGADLGDATKKDDIISAIELHREARDVAE